MSNVFNDRLLTVEGIELITLFKNVDSTSRVRFLRTPASRPGFDVILSEFQFTQK